MRPSDHTPIAASIPYLIGSLARARRRDVLDDEQAFTRFDQAEFLSSKFFDSRWILS
jgi:hypothetical protein